MSCNDAALVSLREWKDGRVEDGWGAEITGGASLITLLLRSSVLLIAMYSFSDRESLRSQRPRPTFGLVHAKQRWRMRRMTSLCVRWLATLAICGHLTWFTCEAL